ncbi:hypothetical protein HHI36_002272 [Cryptolaemus montrouzieri]|uniref:FXNA-like protease n=1 Tax=Cryptolaemus montrouzieri TaxID=559131 RepID=A0ABD2PAW9_9CUCU
MRSRKSVSKEHIALDPGDFKQNEEKRKYPSQTISPYVGILFILFLLALFGLVVLNGAYLPTPLKRTDEALHPDEFITERAQQDLKYLTDLGPRVVGSYENEVLTVEFLKKRIQEIIHHSHSSQKIELDVQIVSGSYYLDSRPTRKINIYANVQNVVVKLYGQDANNSLLLNAHFDSVPTSPGGSDDGINCVAMLEILRLFSKHKTRPLYSVIFLFNGAEESGLQASHGFISKHKWAEESKVVINLEAAGAGGSIVMFQTGPNRPWLNEDYGKVPHPSGQTASEELFQANVIPSDTDFRIFRDFGNMVGIDMAFVRDGYRYHTKYDGFNNIPAGSYQQVGDNVLSLVKSIANNPELANENPITGNVVFFNFFGGTFISYTTSTAVIVNLLVFGVSFLTFFISLRRFNLDLTVNTIFYFTQILAATLFGWLLASLSVIFLAFMLDYVGYSMSWYGNPWLAIGIFVIPTIITSTPLLLLIQPLRISRNANCFIQAQTIRLIWTTFMAFITLLGIRTTYPLLILVLFDTLAYVAVLLFKLEHRVWLWKIVYIIISIIPTWFSMSVSLNLFEFFIPLSGRIGSNKIPDIIIGFAAVLASLLTLTPYYFLISVLRKPAQFYKIMIAIFAICLVIVFTPLGFPYSGDVESPTPQRFWILHSQRVFHSEDGGVIKKDSGYFLLNMDRNSPRSVAKYVDEFKRSVPLEDDCKNFLLCGLPLAHQKMTEVVKHSTWIPASAPIIPEPVNLKVNSKTWISSTTLRYNLSIFGPDHSMFYLSPKKNLKLLSMSLVDKLADEDVLWNDRPYYFFVYTCGKEVVPVEAIFDFSVPENHSGPVMDIAVAGNYVHPKKFRMTPDFKKFLSKFPDWADMTAWVANYQSWIV